MCDQVISSSSTVEEVESDSNSDCDLGALSPIRCSSPGSQSWFAYAWSELLEHHISPNPASTPWYELNNFDISSSDPPVSFPEFHDDRGVLDSQGLCFSLCSHSYLLELFEPHIPLIPASTRRQLFDSLKRDLPDHLQDFSSLRVSEIQHRHQILHERPDWLPSVSSSEVLELWWCSSLISLPRLQHLSVLVFKSCANLVETPAVGRIHSPHLLMKGELHAYSLRNLMNTTIQHALYQACSSRKSNHKDQSFVACECDNKLFLAQATDCRENNCQFQSFIPCGSSSELSPCRVASIVYFLYLFEELHQDFKVLGSIFDIRTSFCTPSFKFAYHSSPGNAHGNHCHGTLSLSLLVHSKKSPLGFFEILYCPLKACFPSKDKGGPRPNKKKQSGSSPKLDSIMVRSSSNGQRMLVDSLQTFEHSTNASHENREVIVDTPANNQHTSKKSSTIWSAGGWISLQDIEQHYGKKRAEAAETLQVSVSTFKRICRQHGIPRWPSPKRKRDKGFLSARKSNASFQVADASASQSQKAFLSALQPFSSSSTVIETHQESSLFSIQSNHREGDQSHNHNMLGNSETTKGASAEACKARNGRLAIDNLKPDALAKTPQPLQNCMPGEEESEISSMSSQKRKRLDKETDYMEKVTHSEEQLSQMQNFVPKRQAIESACNSSFLTPISGTIEGNNMDYNPNSITYLIADDMDSTRMGVQPSLESLSTEISNSFPCNENTAHNTKLHFDNLIALPLEDLIDPENESSMTKALSTLADNLSLFSEEQAEQILGLSFDFPILVHSWREYSQSQMYSQKSFAEMEKIRDLVETSAKDEETLNVRYEELKSKEKELMAQLEAVQKETAGIAEQRNEKSKQTKYLVSLAEERAAGGTKGKHMMKIATTKLNNLVDQWAKIQSFFV